MFSDILFNLFSLQIILMLNDNYYYGTLQSIFKFLSITFTDIGTIVGVHINVLMPICTALSASFRLFHDMSHIKS